MFYYYFLSEVPEQVAAISYPCPYEKYIVVTRIPLEGEVPITQDELEHVCYKNRIPYDSLPKRRVLDGSR